MSKHEEFPELTQQTQAAYQDAYRAGCRASPFGPTPLPKNERRYLAAFLRKAIKQASKSYGYSKQQFSDELQAIANNLHSPPPPPPPPTLAEARKADMGTPAGRDVVRDFLATLGEGAQP